MLPFGVVELSQMEQSVIRWIGGELMRVRSNAIRENALRLSDFREDERRKIGLRLGIVYSE